MTSQLENAQSPNDQHMNKDGTINDFGGQFAGMDRFVAREEVKKELEKLGLSRGSKEHVMALPRSQSNAP